MGYCRVTTAACEPVLGLVRHKSSNIPETYKRVPYRMYCTIHCTGTVQYVYEQAHGKQQDLEELP